MNTFTNECERHIMQEDRGYDFAIAKIPRTDKSGNDITGDKLGGVDDIEEMEQYLQWHMILNSWMKNVLMCIKKKIFQNFQLKIC